MTEEMVQYYSRRAAEYERVYTYRPWQGDLAVLQRRVAMFCAGRRVFEVACGTGYWTRHAAQQAAWITATDVSEATLNLARGRLSTAAVEFRRADAYARIPDLKARFDAGLAALWLSHVDRSRMPEFLDAFHSHLEPGSPVLMFDERDTATRPLAASRLDQAGNRYEMRTLASGERFEIVKNFYDRRGLAAALGPPAGELAFEELDCFWLASYRVRDATGGGQSRA